ncbi:MAG TPA: metal ABC transporter substrate-binding protein [Pirellulaceae bacterium]|jgi:zinc transport system substrate-binding protein|nr:metal ABC transporter substrate-binding protein [Pirellulaceae bacterium]
MNAFALRCLSSFALLPAALFVLGCGTATDAPAGKPTIYVDSYPLAYFAERLAGDGAKVVFPAPEDVDPAHWKPSDEIVREYQNADLVLLSGSHYANWTSRASLPPKQVVDTTADFPPGSLVMSEEGVVHSHGDEGEHSHESYALHTWLDPKLALLQAEAVRDAVARLLPDDQEAIDRRFAELTVDLSDLEARLAKLKEATQGMPLIASHPVYDYLANAAEWNLRSLHWEPHEMPSEKEWGKLDAICEKSDARWMLWEDEPIEPIRTALEERGVRWIVVRHVGNRPTEGDYLSTMRENYDALATMTASLPSTK